MRITYLLHETKPWIYLEFVGFLFHSEYFLHLKTFGFIFGPLRVQRVADIRYLIKK